MFISFVAILRKTRRIIRDSKFEIRDSISEIRNSKYNFLINQWEER